MPTFEFVGIGTHWHVEIFDQLSEAASSDLLASIQQRIADFDQVYSRFRPDSLVTQMATKSGSYLLPDDAKKLLVFYHSLYQLTAGSFTPLIGQVLVDAGYDLQYQLAEKKLSLPPAWEVAMKYDYPNLLLKIPVQLDFGAAGKGYLIDLVAEELKKKQITGFCIDAGGDILHYQHPAHVENHPNSLPLASQVEPFRIGLENPLNFKEVIGVATITNQSICGSAGSRRKWGRFHHLIDPKTLSSPQHLLATWVIADETILADGLATALYFVPAEHLRARYTFEYAKLNSDFSIEVSPDFPGEFFYQ